MSALISSKLLARTRLATISGVRPLTTSSKAKVSVSVGSANKTNLFNKSLFAPSVFLPGFIGATQNLQRVHTSAVVKAAAATGKYNINTSKNAGFEWYELSGYALAGLTPLAFVLSPSILNVPVDLALGVVIPYHFYSGMSHTIHDYFHLKPWYGLAKIALLVIVALMILGFLNLNLRGEGITEAFKRFWRDTPKEDKKKN